MATDTYVISPTSGKATIKKDPNAILDYTWDWTAYLALITDTIASVTFVLSSGITKVSSSFTSTKVTAFLSGGVVGAAEYATCRIVTTGGRTDDRTIYFKIADK